MLPNDSPIAKHHRQTLAALLGFVFALTAVALLIAIIAIHTQPFINISLGVIVVIAFCAVFIGRWAVFGVDESRFTPAEPGKRHNFRIALGILALCLGGIMICATPLTWLIADNSPPTIVGQNCGTVSGYPDFYSADGGKQAEDCLWQAYQHNGTATLIFTKHATDSGEDHYVTVQPQGGKRSISDRLQRAGEATSSTYNCGGMKQQYTGLFIYACAQEGNLFVPPVVPMNPSVHPANSDDCGRALQGNGITYSLDGLTLFLGECVGRNQQKCTSATLTYIVPATASVSIHNLAFIADSSAAVCKETITDTRQQLGSTPAMMSTNTYICATAKQNQATFTIEGCGDEGNVLIASPDHGLGNAPDFSRPPVSGVPCSSQNPQCLVQAYAQCTAAMLQEAFPTNIAAVAYTLVIVPTTGGCVATVSLQFRYSGSSIAPYHTMNCSGVREIDNEVVATDCGSLGTLFFP